MINTNNPLARQSGEGRNPADKKSPEQAEQHHGLIRFAGHFFVLNSGLRRNNAVLSRGQSRINTTGKHLALASLMLAFASTSHAAPVSSLSGGQTGLVEFTSITPANIYTFITKQAAPTVTISATLTLPNGALGKVPAMILAHHCGGITSSVTNLAAMLNSIGIATFIPDSFTARGYPNGVCTGSTLNNTAATADALHALKLLATHPSIDSSRIGIIGQSYGGTTVYNTAFEEARTAVIDDQLKFATHIGLYPSGCTNRSWSDNMTGAPMLLLLGGADDWTGPEPCKDFSLLLRSRGTQTTTIVYPNAPHAWDSPGTLNYNSGRRNQDDCHYQFRLDTLQSSRYDTGEILSGSTAIRDYINSCVRYGASQGRDDATKAAAYTGITIFLAKTFNLTNVTLPASQPDRIFNLLEATYPELISPAGSASQSSSGYYYRYYPNTNSFVATRDGWLYYYAPDNSPDVIPVLDEATALSIVNQAGY